MLHIGTDTEFLGNSAITISPNTTYTESMLIRHNGTLTGGNITFYVPASNSHHTVPFTIEVIRDDAIYSRNANPYTISRISAT